MLVSYKPLARTNMAKRGGGPRQQRGLRGTRVGEVRITAHFLIQTQIGTMRQRLALCWLAAAVLHCGPRRKPTPRDGAAVNKPIPC